MIGRILATALSVAGMSTAAMGQTARSDYGRAIESSRQVSDQQMLRTQSVGVEGSSRFLPRSGNDPQRRECLKHNKTGRLICLTRGEWEAVAAGKMTLRR